MGSKMVHAYTVPNQPLNKHRWEDRIIIGRKQIVWEGVDWTDVAQDRDKARDIVNSTTKLQGNLTD